MATATLRGDKTKFVNDFLTKNPQGNFRAVNEAWTAEGMSDTISKSVVDSTRAKLGLTGTLGATTKTTAKSKGSNKRTKPATTPGKTMFVKEFLNDHPKGNAKAVNEAWTATGFEGTISRTLVDKIRASLGLTGNENGKTGQKTAKAKATPTSTHRSQKPARVTSDIAADTKTQDTSRTTALLATEVEIDRLIFQVMGLGDLPEIETALRDARRAVYKAMTS